MVGDERAGRVELEDTHRPEAFRVAPFAVPQAPAMRVARGCPRWAVRRLRPPEPVTVTLRQRRPEALVFRNQRYAVEQSFGPWFFSGNWWGAEIWSVEKWDLIARAGNSRLCCCVARHALRTEWGEGWRMEALYD